MSVTLLLWRTRLRASWRAAVALVILTGLGGGVTLAVAAGARRTASANEAILARTNAPDLSADHGPEDPRRIEELVRSAPGVTDLSVWVGFEALTGGFDHPSRLSIVGYWEQAITVGRPVVTAGRFPAGAGEGMLNETAAVALGKGPGDRLEIALADRSFSDFETMGIDVVGVGFFTDEVIQDDLTALRGMLVARPFVERHLDRSLWGSARVDVGPGGNPSAVANVLAERGVFVDEFLAEDRARVQDALRPLLTALAGLAALAGSATVLVVGLALSRLVRLAPADDRSLRAVGATGGQLRAVRLLHTLTVAGAGAAVAVATAVVASPLFPVGPARRSNFFEGASFDGAVLGAGATALVLCLLAVVALGTRHRGDAPRAIALGRAPSAFGGRIAMATGIRMATAQRGMLTTVAVVAAGLTVVAAAATFTGSLDRLVHDESLVGMTWDVGGRGPFNAVDLPAVREAVAGEPRFERVTGLNYYVATVDGTAVPVAVLEPVKGSPWPPLVAGRVPSAPDEVLLGQATLRLLELEIGDELEITLPENLRADEATPSTAVLRRTIVGSGVVPAIGETGNDTPRLDVGAVLSTDALGALATGSFTSVLLFDLAEGVDDEAVFDRFPGGLPFPPGIVTEWFSSASPAEVSQAAHASDLIWLGVAAMAVTVVATVAHALLGAVRQRRRAYAVLKTLGFTGRQVRAAVLWQSGIVLGVALIAAVPTGVAAGRWLWRGFAERLGIVADPVVPVILLLTCLLATTVAVQAVALLPATVARRTPPARSLRAE